MHLLDGRIKDAMEFWAPIEPPGQFLAHCSAYYVAAHRRALRDKVPTVPLMLASERLLNPHFDRGLRRYADIIFALVNSQDGVASASDQSPRAVDVAGVIGAAATSASKVT